MVRRVLPGRRRDRDRRLRWTGPPPLLMIATVAALAITPFLDDDAAPREQVAVAAVATPPSPAAEPSRTAEPQPVRPQRVATGRGGQATRGIAPVRLKPVTVGVASFNMFRKLSAAHAHDDAVRLARDPGIDVIGWQEAQHFAGVVHRLPGWQTRTFAFAGGDSELAVSWRASEFRFVSAKLRRVAPGVGWGEGLHPFTSRTVATVTLEHRATGRWLTIIDTHLPQAIEDLDDLGTFTRTINTYRARNQLERVAAIWKREPGRWVVGTGDYNFDARADAVHHPPGGPRRTLGPTAVSSYMKLGTRVTPTFPENGRHIDYVWADRRAYAAGRIRFAGQRVVGGLNSDHNALVVRLVLS